MIGHKILLAFSRIMNFKLFQINVKSAFKNEYIKEKVYVDQPQIFINLTFLDHVFKLKKVLYYLK